MLEAGMQAAPSALIMPSILVVDPDTAERNVIAKSLYRQQRWIDVAAHGVGALESVAHRTPDLVITELEMPRMDGWALIERLRSSTFSTPIPVMVVTKDASTQNRVRALRMGAVDVLAKPVDLEELELRVQNILHHARHARLARCGPELTGDLAVIGLGTALTLLELERRSGTLVIERERDRAQLAVKDGCIVTGELTQRAGCSLVDCMSELLAWPSGRFVFQEEDIEGDGEATPLSAILLEAARVSDEMIPVTQ
jgi:DNA-binding response OmpR family regulator